MKKIIFNLFAVLAISCSFVACGDDDNDYKFDFSASEGSAGTYVGTYSKVLDGSDEAPVVGEGTITLTATAEADVTQVAFDCPTCSISAQSIANVTHANKGYIINNQIVSADNTLGVSFAGKIYDNGAMKVTFSTSEKVGRKNYTYNYTFEGTKR